MPEDIRFSFDQVPEVYDRVRPGYPAAFFDRLFDVVGPSPTLIEVGPGTGQATGDLLDRGALVTAVEIGPRLASFLRNKFAGHQRLTVVNQPFEEVSADVGPVDGVVSATAYHWIRGRARTEQPHRLLRPGGVLAVIDLIHVASDTDRGYFDRVQPIYASFGDTRHDWTPPTHDTARPGIADELEASPRFDRVELHREVWDQTYTSARYRDLLLSYSGTQMMPPSERAELVDQLVAVVDDEYDGVLTRPLCATLTLARAV